MCGIYVTSQMSMVFGIVEKMTRAQQGKNEREGMTD
jgi:hypothetical protein